MKLRVPSPALVISFIALLVALSATAYAATRITSTSHIKNGIITSSDIKNRTILQSDLSKTTLKRIDKGGASGATAFEGVRKVGPLGQGSNTLVKVAKLRVPAGSYVVSAKTTLSGITSLANVAATGTCKLNAGGDEDQSDTLILADGRPVPNTMYLQSTRTVGSSTEFDLTCGASGAFNVTNTSIIAQRVSSTDKSNVSG